jgi:hypothetical protein
VDGGKFFGDVGLPGPDGGKGGKFLIVPPGHKGAVPKGYFVYRSGTNNMFVFLRAFYQDPKDLSPGVKVMEATKIYPLGAKAPKAMQYPDASGVPANLLPRSDATAFDQLKQLVDSEGADLADPEPLYAEVRPSLPGRLYARLLGKLLIPKAVGAPRKAVPLPA